MNSKEINECIVTIAKVHKTLPIVSLNFPIRTVTTEINAEIIKLPIRWIERIFWILLSLPCWVLCFVIYKGYQLGNAGGLGIEFPGRMFEIPPSLPVNKIINPIIITNTISMINIQISVFPFVFILVWYLWGFLFIFY